MSHISGKRAATSPLNSEFHKRPKLGLSNKELTALNEALEHIKDIPVSRPEDVKLHHLGHAFREVALQTSDIDETWRNITACREFASRLSSQERLDVATLWIKARSEGWETFANHCALLPFRALLQLSQLYMQFYFRLNLPVQCQRWLWIWLKTCHLLCHTGRVRKVCFSVWILTASPTL